jgi:hypothetical protein
MALPVPHLNQMRQVSPDGPGAGPRVIRFGEGFSGSVEYSNFLKTRSHATPNVSGWCYLFLEGFNNEEYRVNGLQDTRSRN